MNSRIKDLNKRDIVSVSKLRVIESLLEFGQMSRSDLADCTNLSRSTLTELSRELIARGIVHEISVCYSKQHKGRPSVLLSLKAEHGYFIGVCLTDHSPILVLCDLHGNPLGQRSITISDEPEVIAREIKSGISDLLCDKQIKMEQILGIGLALSGFVDREQGVCLYSISLGWCDVPIANLVTRATGIPTYIENDANAVATGEKLFGHAREAKNFSMVTISKSVGYGHYINGRLHRGQNGGAGEIGHCAVDLNGLRCPCGKVGCLDTIVGFGAMMQSAKDHQLTVKSVLDLESLATNGNPNAISILRRAGQALGATVANIIQINNPEMVLFAYTEGLHNGIFATSTRQAIENNILPRFLSSTSIRFYQVKKDFWARGAASIAAYEFLCSKACWHQDGVSLPVNHVDPWSAIGSISSQEQSSQAEAMDDR